MTRIARPNSAPLSRASRPARWGRIDVCTAWKSCNGARTISSTLKTKPRERLAGRGIDDQHRRVHQRLLREHDRYDPQRASVGTWLVSIARNLLIDHTGATAPANQESIDDRPDDRLPAAPGTEDIDLDIAPDLAAALEGLNQRERELIALRYGADMTGPEIAELTGLTLRQRPADPLALAAPDARR